MKIIVTLLATLLITSTPALAAHSSDAGTRAAAGLTISARCQQLEITCTQPELLQIGRKLEQLYQSRYNEKPPQQRGVNIYTTTDTDLVDRAIINQLATENEKLRQDLELREIEIGQLKKGK